MTSTELVHSYLLEKNILILLSFWKSSVHNFFSNYCLDKPYKILGKVLKVKEIQNLMSISRLKIVKIFGENIKMISKNKTGRFIHRMSSLNNIKAPNLIVNKNVFEELIKTNLSGFEKHQGIHYNIK